MTMGGMSFRAKQRYASRYYRRTAKPRSMHRVGIETEHLCVRKSDGVRLPYESADGPCVRHILETILRQYGGQPVESGGALVGVQADWGAISLEPGGQIEWASPPTTTLAELLDNIALWLRMLRDALETHGATTIQAAYDRTTALRDIPWVPKRRYEIMRHYYYPTRQISYAAMGLTAGIHVSLDYSDERDWARKFRAMLLASPVAIAIFANSPRHRGLAQLRAARPLSWLFMDPLRCQLPAAAFQPEFTLERWIQWVLNVPQLIRLTNQQLTEGSLTPFGRLPLDGTLFTRAWRLHLSSIFTPVRSDGRLEVRTVDMQPDELIGAAPAFWTGLLYSPQVLDQLLDRLSFIDGESTWLQLYHRACSSGMSDPRLATLTNDILRLATHGLHDVEPDPTRSCRLLNQVRQGLSIARTPAGAAAS